LRKKRVAAHALYKEACAVSFFYFLFHTFTIPSYGYLVKPSVGFGFRQYPPFSSKLPRGFGRC
jgi:hypothetical protein